jgi:hypothetical protein
VETLEQNFIEPRKDGTLAGGQLGQLVTSLYRLSHRRQSSDGRRIGVTPKLHPQNFPHIKEYSALWIQPIFAGTVIA